MGRDTLFAGIIVSAVAATAIAVFAVGGFVSISIAAVNAVVVCAATLLSRSMGRSPMTPDQLETFEHRLARLADPNAEVVLVVDAEGTPTYVSPSVTHHLGWELAELLAMDATHYLHGDDLDDMADAFAHVEAHPDAVAELEVRIRARRGWRWAQVLLRNALADPVIGGFVLSQRDITEARRTAELLAARSTQQGAIAQLGRRALEGADAAELAAAATEIVVTGLGVTRCALFRAVRNHDELLLVSVSGDDVAGEPRSIPLDRTTLVWETMITAEPHVVDVDGTVRPLPAEPVEAVALGVTVNGKHRRYGVMTVTTLTPREFSGDDVHFLHAIANSLALALERRGAEEAANNRALHDPLTKLANRVLFLDRLERGLDEGSQSGHLTGVFFIDLDYFKQINDTMGHAAGDALLVEVARRLQKTLRPGDLVARFGGDEFTALCQHLTSAEQADRIADRIRDSLRPPMTIDGTAVTIAASIGYVLSDADDTGDAAESLLQWADTAMYEAKQRGRGRVERFAREREPQAMARLRTETDLRSAVAADQLFCDYQPIVELPSERVTAVEALVRWRHPELGVIPPEDFIPVSEESGIIEEIGDWVLQTAMRQTVEWRRNGLEIVTSVNLSARQLVRTDLVPRLSRFLAATGCHPSWLCLEINEAALHSDLVGAASAVHGLKSLGCQIAIDDFGSGFTSLTHLRRLPIDVLKLDPSFVSDRGASDFPVIGALVNLATTLGMRVVAKGVETRQQLAALSRIGCAQAQGFEVSRPAPPAATSDLVPPADLRPAQQEAAQPTPPHAR